MRGTILVVLGFALSMGSSAQLPAERKTPCETPTNTTLCYWTHGRLSAWDGAPTIRIWKIGTRHMLGIYSSPEAERLNGSDDEHPEMPANIQRIFKPFQNRIFADFKVCPIKQAKPDPMQAACIESAKNVVVQKF